MKDDVHERELQVSAGDLERAIKEKQSAERRPRIQRIEKKEKDHPLEIDLHADALLDTTAGMSNADLLEYQRNKFNAVMSEQIRNKNQKIVFIHGKGDGVLKNAIVKELKTKYPKCDYQDASFQEYGYGATMVTIK
jgi:dsDNA-specific endonuclease/ATPase MutS2